MLGRVVEVASGQPLDAFFAERILGPLGMDDTGFSVDGADLDRLATLYVARDGAAHPQHRDGRRGDHAGPRSSPAGAGWCRRRRTTTASPRCSLRGGELDGVRLLGPRTVAYMTRNHLPGDADLETIGRPIFAESAFRGRRLRSRVLRRASTRCRARCSPARASSPGAGSRSTAFYVDPVEEITAMFFTQFLPGPVYPMRSAAARAGHAGGGGLMGAASFVVRGRW